MDSNEYFRNARNRAKEIKDYFDDEEEEEEEEDPEKNRNETLSMDNDEVDPLDAFMSGIDQKVKEEKKEASKRKVPIQKPELISQDNEMDELYTNEISTTIAEDYDSFDDDEEAGRVPDSKKIMETLAPLDHANIYYEPFRKNFYTPHPAVLKLSDQDVKEFCAELDVQTSGNNADRPIKSFAYAGLDRITLAVLMNQGIEAPTPIQSQALPVALSGRDIIGIAKTGSGKTLAFVLPMIVHVMDQRHLEKGEGPIAMILAPTRELAHQIYVEAKRYAKQHSANCAAIYGGTGKWDQIKSLNQGAEIVVATPGRLIDMIKKRSCKMNRVTFLVLDEADRMFDLGFEPQIRSIVGQIRKDRQTLLFSATFRKKIELLASDILDNPVRITVGKIGQANEDIRQVAVVLSGNKAKWDWLVNHLHEFIEKGKALLFVSSKSACEELSTNLNVSGFASCAIHGDKSQHDRSTSLIQFKNGKIKVLVATDVAARGLDVKDIQTVVNIDTPKNIETYIHRIGRTGRMGIDGVIPGTAYTLLTNSESYFACQLVNNMDLSHQEVSQELLALAQRDSKFFRKHSFNSSLKLPSNRQDQNDGGMMLDKEEYEQSRSDISLSTMEGKRDAGDRRGLGLEQNAIKQFSPKLNQNKFNLSGNFVRSSTTQVISKPTSLIITPSISQRVSSNTNPTDLNKLKSTITTYDNKETDSTHQSGSQEKEKKSSKRCSSKDRYRHRRRNSRSSSSPSYSRSRSKGSHHRRRRSRSTSSSSSLDYRSRKRNNRSRRSSSRSRSQNSSSHRRRYRKD